VIKPFWILAALILLAPPKPATAGEPASSESADTGGLFTQLDVNKDGQLTTDEIPDDRRSLFDRLLRIGDKNSDGKLDADEFAAGLSGGREKAGSPSEPERPARPDRDGRGPGRLFDRLDANGDGKIELDEVPEPGRERFKKLIARVDKDGDGAITRQEFVQAGPRPDAKKGDSKKPGEGNKAKRPQAVRDPSALFRHMDRNADGKLSADEVPEERRPMLERLIKRGDKDGDESLSLEEFTAAFAKFRPAQPPADAGPRQNKAGGSAPGLFGAIDANHDGQLDSGEIAAAADAIRALDKDGDGTVSAREVMADVVRNKKKKNK